MKSGYSEAIAWHKVRLTKQRNVDLTTDGLWAMPLNTACEGTQAAKLAKIEEIRSHSQAGRCLPQWSPSTCGREQQCRRLGFGIISGPVPCIVKFPAVCSKIWSPAPPPPPPPNPHISETAFSYRFQKVYTYPPKGNDILRIGRKVQKLQEKCQNPPSWRTMNVLRRYIAKRDL